MAKKTVEVSEETSIANPFVDTLWNQYEQSLDQVRKVRERNEDSYLAAVKQIIKFNNNYRNTLANLYQTSKESNSNIVKGISSNFNKGANSLVSNPEVAEQFREVSDRVEQLAASPIKSSLELIDRLEKGFEDNSENYINFARERRNDWQNVVNEYVTAGRNSHKKLVSRFEESMKVLAAQNR